MNKKSQIGQVFIYLISTLVIILVLYFGYNAISGITKKQQELSFVKFQTSLKDMVSYTSSDYGTVRVEDFYVPSTFTEVCFVDPHLITTRDSSPILQSYPVIIDSVESGVLADVFALQAGAPFYIEKINVTGDFLCVPVTNGKIRIRIEGKGDSAQISSS